MDPRVALLKEFSSGFVSDKAKVESEQFGFAYLDRLLSGGGTLEYGFLADTRLLHKYKIVDLTGHRMDELLAMHVMKECNVCRYFSADKNDVLCFNMDDKYRKGDSAITEEMSMALDALSACLMGLGCEPLTVVSGRGYHVWLRLAEPLENKLLYNFMVQAAARALLPLLVAGRDHRAIRFRFYPDVAVNDALSLRLFGSEHANTRVFSHVRTPEALLDEDDSWHYFERFVRNKTTATATFRSALDELLSPTLNPLTQG
jgi:hypothetical protein